MSRDVRAASRLEGNLGSAALKRGEGETRWELADVVAYNVATHTAIVRTHSGRPLPDVPQIKTGPRDFTMLENGTTVVISWDLGFPAIVGVISFVGTPQSAIVSPSITNVDGVGDNNPLQPTQGSNNYKPPIAPPDLTAGDWARVGTLGNAIAILEGGISHLGAPSAFIRSLGAAGLLQLVAQRLITVTDFGQWSVENDQGRTSFILRAGANQSTQTGLDEQHWTIRLDVGATGDLFNFQITDPTGKTLFKLHIGADGRTQLYGDAGVDISSGPNGDNETLHDTAGNRTHNVGGDDVLSIQGSRAKAVGGSISDNITTDKTTAIGNDESRFVNKDQAINVGGKRTDIVVGGPAQDAKKGTIALETHVVNGGYLIDIGNPSDGANISAQAAFELRTNLGDISFEAGAQMHLKAKNVMTLDSDALIELGGSSHPLPLWDDFLRDLAQFLTQLMLVLQAGTAGTALKQQLVGLAAATAQLQQFISKVSAGTTYESTKVKNG